VHHLFFLLLSIQVKSWKVENQAGYVGNIVFPGHDLLSVLPLICCVYTIWKPIDCTSKSGDDNNPAVVRSFTYDASTTMGASVSATGGAAAAAANTVPTDEPKHHHNPEVHSFSDVEERSRQSLKREYDIAAAAAVTRKGARGSIQSFAIIEDQELPADTLPLVQPMVAIDDDAAPVPSAEVASDPVSTSVVMAPASGLRKIGLRKQVSLPVPSVAVEEPSGAAAAAGLLGALRLSPRAAGIPEHFPSLSAF
jgi:hypothetical protein